MAIYRLRYQSTDLEMIVGDFVVGRSSSCSLALDDALVSRQHAVFRVSPSEVLLEDMGSRNGVSVNGERVDTPRQLHHLDQITIGSQEMVFIEVQKPKRREKPTGRIPTLDPRTTLEGELPRFANAASTMTDPEEETSRADTFLLIAMIADKALAMQRYEEAERMALPHLEDLMSRAKEGKPVSERHMQTGTRLALALVSGPERRRYIEWVLQLYTARARLMKADDIDRLYELVRTARYTNARAVRDYIDTLTQDVDTFGASEKFLMKRLEGLERVVGA
ncbi:MAG: FHA domain-containing protein [Myxococcota bacterium]